MDEYRIIKYPRTPHIEGSRLQPGDEDLSQIPFAEIAGLPLVIEEKIDGANSALSFDPSGQLLLQSRGHYLTGGYLGKALPAVQTVGGHPPGSLLAGTGLPLCDVRRVDVCQAQHFLRCLAALLYGV